MAYHEKPCVVFRWVFLSYQFGIRFWNSIGKRLRTDSPLPSLMFSPSVLPDNLCLQHHPTARDRAVSTCRLSAGRVILLVRSLTSLLLPNEKGRRCDFCHSLAPQDRGRLQRCTGCASYWYCDSKCTHDSSETLSTTNDRSISPQGQTLHWRTHKKYCKNLNAFFASRQFNQLESHQKLDALLLTHLLAECSARGTETKEGDNPGLSIFVSLLPGPVASEDAPPTCPLLTSHGPVQTANELFSRFGNNNFSIHSHLTTLAYGVFPLASRSFNHSCVPNAVAKYRIAPGEEVVMEIVLIRDIAPGEEVSTQLLLLQGHARSSRSARYVFLMSTPHSWRHVSRCSGSHMVSRAPAHLVQLSSYRICLSLFQTRPNSNLSVLAFANSYSQIHAPTQSDCQFPP